jgi:hypothetical protein
MAYMLALLLETAFDRYPIPIRRLTNRKGWNLRTEMNVNQIVLPVGKKTAINLQFFEIQK